jgi:hypothetical protein
VTADDPAAILAGWREAEQAATKGEWCAEPPTGAGRVWVQIGRRHFAGADCEPLFNFRTHREPVDEAEKRRQYAQREADAAFIVTARTAMPVLLAVAEAALKHHQRHDRGPGMAAVCSCPGRPLWPCPERRDLEAALTGEVGRADET